MREMLDEVMTSMKNNKLRIALTGFAIGWGMFILVVLLGSASGLQRGLGKSFHLDVDQVVNVSGGTTTLPWEGLQKGRYIQLTLDDAQMIANSHIEKVRCVYPKANSVFPISYGANYIKCNVTGCNTGHIATDYHKLVSGRDINYHDLRDRTKVCIINMLLAYQMFKDRNPIGNRIDIAGNSYLVVGVCKNNLSDSDLSPECYIPLTTFMSLYRPKGDINNILITVNDVESADDNEQIVDQLRSVLSTRKQCSPDDQKAIVIDNPFEYVLSAKSVVKGIGVFVWFIGIATLITGIVGVSNITLINVKERTRELGVRRAMGASNNQIIGLVISESLIITMIFGYVGMMIGVGLTQLLSALLGDTIAVFQNPTANFWALIVCNLIIIASGLVAGYMPAKRAVKIKLVDALTGS